jgi:hypothetical protein
MHGPSRASELLGGLGQRQALDVAEDDRPSRRLGQSGDLGVEDLGVLALGHRVLDRSGGGRLSLTDGPVVLGPPDTPDAAAGLAGGPEGDAMEPGAEGVAVADRSGLPRQDEENGLEGVLGVVGVAKELSADGEDHRAVPGDDRGESGLGGEGVAIGVEPLEELAVGQPDGRAGGEERPELPGDRSDRRICHARGPPVVKLVFPGSSAAWGLGSDLVGRMHSRPSRPIGVDQAVLPESAGSDRPIGVRQDGLADESAFRPSIGEGLARTDRDAQQVRSL